MSRTTMIATLMIASFTIALGACRRDASTATVETDAPANDSATVPAPAVVAPAAPVVAAHAPASAAAPLLEGTQVDYDCDSGPPLTVTYTYVTAQLRWADGREAGLSRVASPSRNDIGVDVYANGKQSLRHAAQRIQIQTAGAGLVTCEETASSA